MPGRVEGLDPERAEIERLAVPDRAVLVTKLRANPDDVARTGRGHQLAPARHVVVVEMGLDHVADPPAVRARGVEVDVNVPTRIDDRGDAGRFVGDQRAEVAKPLDDELLETHVRSLLGRGKDERNQEQDPPRMDEGPVDVRRMERVSGPSTSRGS